MAPHGRRKSTPITVSLFAEGYQFDFYQAVKLIDVRVGADEQSVSTRL